MLRGVVTRKLVVTTQGGVVTTLARGGCNASGGIGRACGCSPATKSVSDARYGAGTSQMALQVSGATGAGDAGSCCGSTLRDQPNIE